MAISDHWNESDLPLLIDPKSQPDPSSIPNDPNFNSRRQNVNPDAPGYQPASRIQAEIDSEQSRRSCAYCGISLNRKEVYTARIILSGPYFQLESSTREFCSSDHLYAARAKGV